MVRFIILSNKIFKQSNRIQNKRSDKLLQRFNIQQTYAENYIILSGTLWNIRLREKFHGDLRDLF